MAVSSVVVEHYGSLCIRMMNDVPRPLCVVERAAVNEKRLARVQKHEERKRDFVASGICTYGSHRSILHGSEENSRSFSDYTPTLRILDFA